MGVFRSFYDAIAPHRARGKAILAVIDVTIFVSIMIAIPLIRKSAYGSISVGTDLLAGFLVGFMVFVAFNAVVYFGGILPPKSLEEGT